MFILDAENFRQAKISLTLIFINIFCYIFINIYLGTEAVYLLAQSNIAIIQNFEVWRLFTAMFLHGDILHLFYNMIALLLFGTAVEMSYSKTEYLIIYFISGLIGNLFSLLLLPLNSISLGASGAIFGLLGAIFSIYIIEEDKSLMYLGLFYIAFFLGTSFMDPQINLWAHLFGLIGGMGFGYIFNQKYKNKERY